MYYSNIITSIRRFNIETLILSNPQSISHLFNCPRNTLYTVAFFPPVQYLIQEQTLKLVIIISTCSKIGIFLYSYIHIYIYFKVLTFLESTRQLTRYSLHIWGEKYNRSYSVFFSVNYIRRHRLICASTGEINFNHRMKVALFRFLRCKVAIFIFPMNK